MFCEAEIARGVVELMVMAPVAQVHGCSQSPPSSPSLGHY